jgi:hypothetical protein
MQQQQLFFFGLNRHWSNTAYCDQWYAVFSTGMVLVLANKESGQLYIIPIKIFFSKNGRSSVGNPALQIWSKI